ncbi:type IVB secretion system protein IcmX [Legionella sp. PC997]|uniref:type IVB secretion system protein IcmX n=1 Tax=Legionella sp. PC997 TaxID=2755562 RepID=UPI0015FC48B9|nr:type IVB secretion system protein IcmX [Legionella sp. PC997]QMT58958.1 hypothetical protein HBNCFIEN_00318 [Legionella sp. PC997]
MKLASKFVLLNVLFFAVFPAAAQDPNDSYNQQQTSTNMQKLVEYFQNFGNYLGYNVTETPTQSNQSYSISYSLINLTTSQLAQAYQFYTLLGSIPVNTFTSGSSAGGGGTNTGNAGNPYAQFLPAETSGTSNLNPSASILNPLANNTFPNYNNLSSSGQVTVNALMDQKTYQQDPVSQAVLNILGTPNYTYCMKNDQTFDGSCTFTYETLVPSNVVGEIPNALTFFNANYLQQFLNHLNSNALTGPLMYSNQDLGSTQGTGDIPKNGLTAQNQEQLAANFIRYVTGSVIPISLPKYKDYDNLYTRSLLKSITNTPSTSQLQATQTLAKYLASLRTYAAQNSVGISNLYYIMSKRMPQTAPNQQGGSQTSQALNEFNMATWRLYNTTSAGSTNNAGTGSTGTGGTGGTSGTGGTGPSNTPWINSLNNAPPAVVQKEIAILLAEINYQLYLDRQIHERLLMTNSILLLQSVRTGAPSTDFTSGQQP